MIGSEKRADGLSPRARQVVIFSCLFVLISEASRGLVLGSLSTYMARLHGTRYLGTNSALFSAARLVSSLLGGWLCNHTSIKFVFELSLAINVIGSLMYFFAAELGLWCLLLGRLLQGFGSGTLSVARAAIAEVTTPATRTQYMAILDASRYFGYAITPVFGWLLTLVQSDTSSFVFDGVTTPGLLLALMNAGLLVHSRWVSIQDWWQGPWNRFVRYLIQSGVKSSEEPYFIQDGPDVDTPKVVQAKVSSPLPVTAPANITVVPVSEKVPTPKPVTEAKGAFVVPANARVVTAGLILLTICNLVTRGVVAVIEAIGSPLFIAVALTDPLDGTVDSDSVQDATEFFLTLGCVGLITYGVIAKGLIKLPELHILTLSFIFAAAGCAFLVSSSLPSYANLAIGSGLVWSVSAPLSITITVSTFSKLVGNQPQGTHMGIITAAGSVGRIIFLLFVDNVSRNGVMALAAVSSILCGISIVVFKWIVAHPMSARLAAVNTNGFQKQAADGELPLPISKVPQSALESLPTATASPKPRFQLSLPSTAAQGADAIPAQQPAEAKADDAADGKACV